MTNMLAVGFIREVEIGHLLPSCFSWLPGEELLFFVIILFLYIIALKYME